MALFHVALHGLECRQGDPAVESPKEGLLLLLQRRYHTVQHVVKPLLCTTSRAKATKRLEASILGARMSTISDTNPPASHQQGRWRTGISGPEAHLILATC